GACAHFGYAAEELIGLKVADIDPVYADEHKAMQLVEELARTGERTSLVSRHRRKDGTLRDVKLTIFLTQQGAQGMLIVSIKDITEQKRAEQEKKRHEATLDSLINSISDMIFFKDAQGRYLGCNTAFAALAGRPVAEVVGLTCHDVHPPEAAGAEEARDRRC